MKLSLKTKLLRPNSLSGFDYTLYDNVLLYVDTNKGVTLGVSTDISAFIDLSGNDNEPSNGTEASRPDYIDGKAVFSGSDNQHLVSTSSDFDFDENDSATIIINAKIDSYDNRAGLICKKYSNQSDRAGYAIYVAQNGSGVAFAIAGKDSGSSDVQASSSYTTSDTDWHQYALVIDRGTDEMRCYVDGVHQASLDEDISTILSLIDSDNPDPDLYIGRFVYDGYADLDGSIDKIFITNDVLTDEEILTIYETL